MKHLFIFWTEQLNEQRGGIHRVILILLQYLPLRGIEVHYLYTLDDYHTFYVYQGGKTDVERIKVEDLREYLVRHHCDIVLGQDAIFSTTLTRIIASFKLPNVKLIAEYHASIQYITSKLTFSYLRFDFIQNKSLKSRLNVCLKALFYPLWKHKVWRDLSKIYEYNYHHSDVSLLLSDREIPLMKKALHGASTDKCVAISNPLSWEKIEGQEILNEKKKEVLIVSRLYIPEKRIDLALKIWEILQHKGVVADWTLRIVGDGVHKEYLMQMASKLGLKNIIWEGWSDPKPFYRTASLFMMTSACEGWGLTLTESMQTGTVPLAMDTYPAIHDIITDGYDGCIIEGYNLKAYALRMAELIQNQSLREQIARNALISCQRFSTERIIDRWVELLNRI
jgi:glycosyltransferase involved in cell wall biosynthesis